MTRIERDPFWLRESHHNHVASMIAATNILLLKKLKIILLLPGGLICAAPQQGVWYRAQVVQCYEDSDEILIKFMDYGGYATVSDKSIKQIRFGFHFLLPHKNTTLNTRILHSLFLAALLV